MRDPNPVAGARAGEMYFGLKDDCKVDMKRYAYLDAEVAFTPAGPVVKQPGPSRPWPAFNSRGFTYAHPEYPCRRHSADSVRPDAETGRVSCDDSGGTNLSKTLKKAEGC